MPNKSYYTQFRDSPLTYNVLINTDHLRNGLLSRVVPHIFCAKYSILPKHSTLLYGKSEFVCRACIAQSVEHLPSLTLCGRGTIDPSLEPHQCLLTGTWKRMAQLPSWPPRGLAGVTPELNLREHVTCTLPPSANKAIHSGFETHRPRGDITRSPKQRYQWPHKKNLCPPNFFIKSEFV